MPTISSTDDMKDMRISVIYEKDTFFLWQQVEENVATDCISPAWHYLWRVPELGVFNNIKAHSVHNTFLRSENE